MRYYLLIIFAGTLLTAQAQIDTVRFISEKSIKGYVREGTAQYLVFLQMKNKPRNPMVQIWSRSVTFKDDNIIINQTWYSSDSTSNRKIFSIVSRSNFQPLFQKALSIRTGIEAFDFHPDQVKGSDSLKNNSRATFKLQTARPLNFELDLEILPLLDLKANKKFAVYFYHPGGREVPKYYQYSVVGDEEVSTVEGKQIDCWKLRIDFGAQYYAIFYISKKQREMIKVEEDFGFGKRYKMRLLTPLQFN